MLARSLARIGTAAALVAAGVLLAATCGRSDLAKALEPYASKLGTVTDAEGVVWDRLGDLSRRQGDAAGDAAYRRFLEQEAAPAYAAFEKQAAAIVPGHTKLERVHAEAVAYLDLHRRFAVKEVERLQALARDGLADPLRRQQEAFAAADDALSDYVTMVVDSAPDPRLGDLNALVDGFLETKLARAHAGEIAVSEVRAALTNQVLPKLEKMRSERYDDSPQGRAFRKVVVLREEALRLLAPQLDASVEMGRRKREIEKLGEDAKRHAERVRELLMQARRDS